MAENEAEKLTVLDRLLAKFGDFDPQADEATKLIWFESFARLMAASGVGPAADTVFYDEADMEIAKACAFQDGFNLGLKVYLKPNQ